MARELLPLMGIEVRPQMTLAKRSQNKANQPKV